MSTVKKLTRSRRDRMLAGVCGGIANYLDMDPSLVRVLFVIISILSAAFPGTLVYLIMWAIVPEGD